MALAPSKKTWPALPLEAWRDTCATVHRWAQIVGKIQLARTPLTNHWWNVGLHVTPTGLGSSTMFAPDGRWFDVELDFFEDVLKIRVSDGSVATVVLAARPVAELHADTVAALRELGLAVPITPAPQEIVDAGEAIALPEDRRHHAYDKTYVLAFLTILARTTEVLRRFRADFIGKSSPPLLFWGHFDLALSVFSGRPMPGPLLAQLSDNLEREGYSHELVSVGWWPGDSRLARPTFYASAAPEPPGFSTMKLAIPGAYYEASLRSYCLDYDTVRNARDPDAWILEFFRTTYATAADLGRWDRKALERGARK